MPHSCSRLFRRVSSFALLACVALHFTASLAPAAILTATIPGSPNWRGDGPFTIGTRFTVGASPIDINSLGVMIRPGDNGGNFYSSGVLVGLWDNSGNLLRTTQVLQAQVNDRVDNGYAYVLVAPITLSAGATYRIGAVVGSGRAFFLDSYPSTSFAAGPGVTQNQSVFNSGATLTFPNSDGAVTGRWGAANATLLTAGTSTWNGGSGSSNNLTDNANWGGADLKAGDHLVFAGSTRTTPNNNILANTGFSSITFNSGAGSFTLGGNAINLLGNVVNNSTNLQTINTALVLDGATRTFDAASGNITVGGAISQANGTHGLIKNGTGTLTLTSSASTFAGGVTLNNGTLVYSANSTPSTANAVVTSGPVGTGTLTLNGGTLRAGTGGVGNQIISNAVQVNGTITVSTAGWNVNLSGPLSGSGTLNTSSVPLFLLGNNSGFSGVINVNNGSSTQMGAANSASAAATYNLVAGGTLSAFANGTFNLGSLSGAGGTVQALNGGAINPVFSIGALNTSTSFNGAISNGNGTSVSLTKVGSGTLTLGGANTYTGATTINAGVLQIGAGSNAGALSASSAITVNSNGTLRYFRSDSAHSITNSISGSGAITFLGTGVSLQSDYIPTGIGAGYTGTITVDKARLQANTNAITFGNAAEINVLSGGQLGLGFTSGAAISRPINIAGTGWLESLGAFGAIRMENGSTVSGLITLTANATITSFNSTSTNTLSGGINNNGFALTLDPRNAAGNTIAVTNAITGAGSLTKTDIGTVRLSAANTYSGATSVSAGTLNLAHSLALQNSTLTTAGIVFDQSVATRAFTFGGLSGSGNIVLQNNAGSPAAVALSVGNNNGSTTYSGSLSGAGSLTKIGSGTLTLTNAHTYTGTTTVSNGTLLLNGSLTGAGGAITVQSGGTLGGSGSTTRAVNVQAGGTLSPGNSPDQIFTGALTLAPLSVYEVEILGTAVGNGVTGYDQTVVTGGVSLNGALLEIAAISGVGVGDSFTIIDNDGADAVIGTFWGLAEGVEFVAGSFYMSITYVGGVNNNDVVLTINNIVPEPGSLTLCGLALLAGGGLMWRKQKRRLS